MERCPKYKLSEGKEEGQSGPSEEHVCVCVWGGWWWCRISGGPGVLVNHALPGKDCQVLGSLEYLTHTHWVWKRLS